MARKLKWQTLKGKQSFKSMVEHTKHHATNQGQPWSDEDVEYLVHAIEGDGTTYEMALGLGRSFYSAQTARAHVSFALRHANAIYNASNVKPLRRVK